MIAASPPQNEKAGDQARLPRNTGDSATLLRHKEEVNRINLATWRQRGEFMLEQYVATGEIRHLRAIDALLAAIKERVSLL